MMETREVDGRKFHKVSEFEELAEIDVETDMDKGLSFVSALYESHDEEGCEYMVFAETDLTSEQNYRDLQHELVKNDPFHDFENKRGDEDEDEEV